MKYFEVGFEVSEGIFSVNTIWANTGREELEAVTETAERRAARHGYKVAYIKEINGVEAEVANLKGRPLYPIDDEAERAHDPSFAEEAEEAPVEPSAEEAVDYASILGHEPTEGAAAIMAKLDNYVERKSHEHPEIPPEMWWADVLEVLEQVLAEREAEEEPTVDMMELYISEEDMEEWMELVEGEFTREVADEVLSNILKGIMEERPELAEVLDNTGKLSLIVRNAYLIGFKAALHEVHGVQGNILSGTAPTSSSSSETE